MGSNGSRARRTLEDSVFVDVDVLRFTTGPDAEAVVAPERRGKYLGILGEYKLASPCLAGRCVAARVLWHTTL